MSKGVYVYILNGILFNVAKKNAINARIGVTTKIHETIVNPLPHKKFNNIVHKTINKRCTKLPTTLNLVNAVMAVVIIEIQKYINAGVHKRDTSNPAIIYKT